MDIESVIKRMLALKDHCESFILDDGYSDEWKRDVQAIDGALVFLEKYKQIEGSQKDSDKTKGKTTIAQNLKEFKEKQEASQVAGEKGRGQEYGR